MASPSISAQSIIQAIIDFFRNLFGLNKVSQSTASKSTQPSKVINKTTMQSITISKTPIITRTTPVSTIAVPVPPITNVTYNYPFKTKIPLIPMKQPIVLSPSINPSVKTTKTVVKGVSLPPDFIAYAEKTQSKINENKAINIKNVSIVPNVPLSKKLTKNRIPIAEKPTNKNPITKKSKTSHKQSKNTSNTANLGTPTKTGINNPLPKIIGKPIASPYESELKSKNINKSEIIGKPIASPYESELKNKYVNKSYSFIFPRYSLSRKIKV